MLLSEQFYQTEKTGYLNEQFRLFHLKDQTRKEFSYHYHDFHKVVIFISGKAAYHIEGKAYQLKPWDILLVNRHHLPRQNIHIPQVRTEYSGSCLKLCAETAERRIAGDVVRVGYGEDCVDAAVAGN